MAGKKFQRKSRIAFNHGLPRFTPIKIRELIHCVNAESVVDKTLASALADAFSQHLPAGEASANRYFFAENSGRGIGGLIAQQGEEEIDVRRFASVGWKIPAHGSKPAKGTVDD